MDEKKFALKCMKEAQKNNFNLKEYKSYIKRLPSLIMNNGLANTLAFMKSKKDTWIKIYNQIQNWFKQSDTNNFININNHDLMEFVINADPLTYNMVTNKIIDIVSWLKRLVDIYTGEE